MRAPPPPAPAAEPRPEALQVRAQVRHYEANVLQAELEAAGWSRNEAARQLGIPVRTLSYRIKVLGLRKP